MPIVFAVDGDTVYSVVDAKPKRTTSLRRLENIRVNPAVALLVDYYEEDWSALWWVRAEGTARILDQAAGDGEGEEATEATWAVQLLTARYPQQAAAGLVLAVDVARWSGWAATQ